MLNSILITIFRSIIGYILLLILGRLMGSKLVSRINYFDLLISVTVGSVAARIALGSENSLLVSSVSLVTLTVLAIITDYLNIKSLTLRKIIDSQPVMVICKGKILKNNMKKTRFTMNKLLMELREKDIFNINDVEYAIIETNGEVSILPKAHKHAVTPEDLNISKKAIELNIDLIIDGNILYKNLRYSNHDEKWLMEKLESNNINDVEDVFYACIDPEGKLYISEGGSKKNNEQELV